MLKIVVLAVALTLSIPGYGGQAASAAVSGSVSGRKKTVSPVDLGVKAYNLVKGVSKLYMAMKLGAREEDSAYLQGLADKTKNDRLPQATVKNGDIYLAGLPYPIKVVALKDASFSYNGKQFDLNMKDGAEASFDNIKSILFPQPTAFMQWLLPQANADINAMDMLAGVAGVGGFAMAADQCGADGSAAGCGVGALLGGFGIGYLVTSLLDQQNPPSQMTCYPGNNGCSQVVLVGPNRVPVNTIAQCPGQAVSYSPALRQVYPGAQTMGSSLTEMCSYPGTMSALNSAYATPIPAGSLIPLQTTARVASPFGAQVPTTTTGAPVFLPARAVPASRAPSQIVSEPAGIAR